MTPEERTLIDGVFDRLERGGATTRDREAEALIAGRMARLPNAPYDLTQAVVMLEIGLSQAQQKIADLQHRLDRAPAQAADGGFLGGASPWGGSVPRAGAVPVPSQAPQYAPGGYPQSGPAYAPQQAPSFAQPSAGGGFLRNAATLAAGVAGGTLIAEGLSSLFGGHHGFGGYGGGFGGSPWGAQPGETVENVTTVNNYYDQPAPDSDASFTDSGSSDGGVQDASFDDGGFDGGFDDSSDF